MPTGCFEAARITDDLTLDALGMALARRRPPQGLLHHSDRGSQYASGDYQRVPAQHGIVCSMSRRGDCWDNAVAESGGPGKIFGEARSREIDRVYRAYDLD